MTQLEHSVAVSIMGRTYHIKCRQEDAKLLEDSAKYLDAQMHKLQQASSSHSTERLAVVAALNITQELMAFRDQKSNYIDVMHDQIKSLQNRIQEFLIVKDEAMV